MPSTSSNIFYISTIVLPYDLEGSDKTSKSAVRGLFRLCTHLHSIYIAVCYYTVVSPHRERLSIELDTEMLSCNEVPNATLIVHP